MLSTPFYILSSIPQYKGIHALSHLLKTLASDMLKCCLYAH